jgi:murein L,D-transpeptidase YafK
MSGDAARSTKAPLVLSLSKHLGAALAFVVAGQAVAEPLPRLPVIEQIVVRKSDRVMELYAGGRLVHTIENIQLGGAPEGPKRFQGDRRTPEGRYTIDYANPESGYNLSLHISYPNGDDLAYARSQGPSAGGLIFIHGQPNGWAEETRLARVPGDWTDGCIAVSDDEIEALWRAVPDGAAIDILP